MKHSNIETICINKEDFKTLSRFLSTYKLLIIIWRMPIFHLKELLEFCKQELNESKIYLKNARKRRPYMISFYRKDIMILQQNIRQIKQIIKLKNKKRKAPDFISDIDFTTFMSELQINYKIINSNTKNLLECLEMISEECKN